MTSNRRRLFVDVDDTLVLARGEPDQAHPYIAALLYTESTEINTPLLDRVRAFDGDVFIWSGGGRQYAAQVGNELLPDVEFIALTKDSDSYALVREGDVVVDDQPIVVRTHSPFEVF